MPQAKSCIASHFCLASLLHPQNFNEVPNNALIHTKCWTLNNVVCSVAEAECDGLIHNGQLVVIICNVLDGMGHVQQPTRIKTDNYTENSFAHESMHVKCDLALQL
eukprot:4072904-Ditylum_brightwellii.AAC.1